MRSAACRPIPKPGRESGERHQRDAGAGGARHRQELRQGPGAARRELRGAAERGRRARGRQRRRQEHARQDPRRRPPGRRRRDPVRGPPRHDPLAARRPRARDRDRLPGSRARGRARSRVEPVPGPRDHAPGAARQARLHRQARDAARERPGVRAPERRDPGRRRAGGDDVRRPAPGHRGQPRGDVGEQGRLHGRADRGARRRADAQRARPDRPRARPRPVRGPHQPQHAGGARGRRPDRGAAHGRARRAVRTRRRDDGGDRRRDDGRAPAPGEGRVSTQTTPPDAVEPEQEPPRERARWWQRFVTGSSAPIGLILAGLIVVFSMLEYENFVSVSNARNITTDAAVLLVLAVGSTFVIITAGIDLSVGSVLVFSGVIAAEAMETVGGDNVGTILAGLVASLASGFGWGVVNGFLIAKAKIPPLIVTLGTLGMALGFALLITGGVDKRDVPFKLVETVGTGRLFDEIPYLVLIAFAVALLGGILLAATRFGRFTYAIGSNEEGARRAGVSVDRHLIKVYALAGTLSGLAGFLSLSRFATTTLGGHSTDNLQAIAAVVIGGTSLFGGVGTMLGTVFGVFIPAVLQNGFVIVGLQPFWQQVAVGAVLIIAVYLDQLRRRTSYQR